MSLLRDHLISCRLATFTCLIKSKQLSTIYLNHLNHVCFPLNWEAPKHVLYLGLYVYKMGSAKIYFICGAIDKQEIAKILSLIKYLFYLKVPKYSLSVGF